MPENIGINLNNQNTAPLPKNLTLGRQFGLEINLNIFTAGTEITEENQFLKLFDENNNNILDENEAIKLKSSMVESAGDDNILDDAEFTNLFGGRSVNAEFARASLLTYIANIETMATDNESNPLNNSHVIIEMNENGTKTIEVIGTDNKPKELIVLDNPIKSEDSDSVFYNKLERYIFRDKEEQVIKVNLTDNNYNIKNETTKIYKNGLAQEIFTEEENLSYKKQEKRNFHKNGTPISTVTYIEYANGAQYASNEKYVNGKPAITINTTRTNGFIIEEFYDYSQYNVVSNLNFRDLNYDRNTTVTQKYDKNHQVNHQTIINSEGGRIEKQYSSKKLTASQTELPTRITKYDSNGNVIEVTKNTFSNGILVGRTVEDKQKGTVQQYDFSEANLGFEDSFQGGIGDCHYLETINSFRQTQGGRNALSSLVTKTKETDIFGKEKTVYHVTYPPIKEIKEYMMNEFNIPEENLLFHDTYDITEDELKEAAKAAGADYSSGDKDILLMEVAFKKYRQDALNTRLKNPQLHNINISDEYRMAAGVFDGFTEGINGGFGLVNRYLLTGKKSDIYLNKGTNIPTCICDMESGRISLDKNNTVEKYLDINPDKSNAINRIYEDFDEYIELLQSDLDEDGNLSNYSISASLLMAPQVVNGSFAQGGGHEFTVKGIRGDDVVLINPWDSTKEVLISKEDFRKAACQFGGIKFD